MFSSSCNSNGHHDHDHEYADVDWDNLGFSLTPTDYMYTMKCSAGAGEQNHRYEGGKIIPYGNIQLSPAAAVLNYGQGIFEGLKAYRKETGEIVLFRPHENALRMQYGAERMCMPAPSVDQFVDAVKQIVVANRRWVPPHGKGALYIRPLLIGNGPILGLAPAPEYTFLIYASPVRNYFKEGSAPLNLYVEDEFHRASRGGAGGVKTISNYAPVRQRKSIYYVLLDVDRSVLKPMGKAKSNGYSDVLYLDSVNNKNIEEVSSCNIFIRKGNLLSTPATNGTILRGITRKSIIEIARDLGYQVEERDIPVDDMMAADEVFCTGTAVVVASVGSITYKNTRVEFAQSLSRQLYNTLVGIQMGLVEDKHNWLVEIE